MDRAKIEKEISELPLGSSGASMLLFREFSQFSEEWSASRNPSELASDFCFLLRLSSKKSPGVIRVLIEHTFQKLPPAPAFTEAFIEEVLLDPEKYASDVIFSAFACTLVPEENAPGFKNALSVRSVLYKALCSPLHPSFANPVCFTHAEDALKITEKPSDFHWEPILSKLILHDLHASSLMTWIKAHMDEPSGVAIALNSPGWTYNHLDALLLDMLKKVFDDDDLPPASEKSILLVKASLDTFKNMGGLCTERFRYARQLGIPWEEPRFSECESFKMRLSLQDPEVFDYPEFWDEAFWKKFRLSQVSLSMAVMESFVAPPTIAQRTPEGAAKLDEFRRLFLEQYLLHASPQEKKDMAFALTKASVCSRIDKKGLSLLIQGIPPEEALAGLERIFDRSVFVFLPLPKNFVKFYAKHISVDDLRKLKGPSNREQAQWWRDYLILRSKKNLKGLSRGLKKPNKIKVM